MGNKRPSGHKATRNEVGRTLARTLLIAEMLSILERRALREGLGCEVPLRPG
jgi:hypothetical protein